MALLSIYKSHPAGFAQNTIVETETLSLSLKDSIVIALKENLDLKAERFNPLISQANLKQVQDLYGLTFGFDTKVNQSVSPSSTSFISGGSILSRFNQNYDVFLQQSLNTGGSIGLTFNNTIAESNSTRVDVNPAITPRLALSFNHPLLKNFLNGVRRIKVSENNTLSANLLLKSKAIDIVSRVQDIYWNLILSRESLKVLNKSLSLTHDLLKINQEKQKAGFLAKIDVLNTKARIASKEENVLQSRRNLANQEDRLKRILNTSGHSGIGWDTSLKLIESPTFYHIDVDYKTSIKKAFKFRPDYLALLLDIENSNLNLEISGQNRLPKLNLNSNAGLESLDQNYSEAVSQLFNFKTYFWNVGLSFEFPVVGNREQSMFLETELKNRQQQTKLKSLKQQITSEVRQSVRNVRINEKRVTANRLAKKLAEEQLKAETEKLNLGLSSNFQVLQYQNDFENASLNEVKAIIDFIKSVNALYATEGILLESYNLSWE